jgi:hypothetical protein
MIRSTPNTGTCFLIMTLLFTGLGMRGNAASEAEREFVGKQAISRVASARTESDFRQAAEVYQSLALLGGRNGALFYNWGTCLLAAGDYEGAARQLVRAERYTGTTPEIERNLLLCSAGGNTGTELRLPWYRTLLFWHFGLPCATRTTLAAAFFALGWIGLSLRAMRRQQAATHLLILSLAGLVLFGTSVGTTWVQENRDNQDGTPIVEPTRNPPNPATRGGTLNP